MENQRLYSLHDEDIIKMFSYLDFKTVYKAVHDKINKGLYPGVECELVDCKVGMWAEWRITGKTRFRTRPVLQQPNEHGQLCPNLMEVSDVP